MIPRASHLTGVRWPALLLPQRQPKAMTEKEVRRILCAMQEERSVRDIAIVEVLLGTRIRVGELPALRVEDTVIRSQSGVPTVPGDLRGLAALLGHASLNTVMVYTEPRLEDLAKRMELAG